jgi:hypothetical protein
VAVNRIGDAEATRVLNDFQRDARAMLEQLLPTLRQRGLYPEASVEGWGDSRDGRGTASTVALVSPKWLKPTDRTKQLARVRLELSEKDEWSVVVSVVAQRDRRDEGLPTDSPQWWTDLREHIRGRIMEYHDSRGTVSSD